MVILIMLFHAIPVFIARFIGGRTAATVVAIISAIIAIFTGSPRYTIHDLAAIAVAYIICLMWKD